MGIDPIHLICGFKNFAAFHFRVFGGGRVGRLGEEGGGNDKEREGE